MGTTTVDVFWVFSPLTYHPDLINNVKSSTTKAGGNIGVVYKIFKYTKSVHIIEIYCVKIYVGHENLVT